jgi:hypothetical protein
LSFSESRPTFFAISSTRASFISPRDSISAKWNGRYLAGAIFQAARAVCAAITESGPRIGNSLNTTRTFWSVLSSSCIDGSTFLQYPQR